jgi:hypothetical protein
MGKLKISWSSGNPKISIRLIGHIFFAFYFFLALLFFKERTIFIDCANFSFDLIQNKNFVFPLGRWASFFTQIIPLLALKWGVSLSFFLKTYSLSIALFYYVVFLIIAYAFKNNNKLIALYLLTMCLTVRNTFYFSIAELLQGLALCVLVYGLAKQLTQGTEKGKWMKTVIIIVLIASLYYFHQLMLFAIIFALLAIIINEKAYKNKQLITAFVFTNIWFGSKILLISSSGYEGKKMPDLQTLIHQIPYIFDLPSFAYFFRFAQLEMWYSIALMFGCLIVLFFRKKRLLATFFLVYFISYLVLIIITYCEGEAPNMYELYYILLGFFIAIIFDLTISNLNQKLVFITFLFVLVFSGHKMYMAHENPSKRIFFLEQLVEATKNHENRKFILNRKDFPWSYAWVTWALPMETMLISSLEDKKNTITCVVAPNKGRLEKNLTPGELHLPPWLKSRVNIPLLDTNYFQLPFSSSYSRLKKGSETHSFEVYD